MRSLYSTSCLTRASLVAIAISAASSPAVANPEGGNVASGQATITEQGKKLDILQHTDKVIIDWRTFDIAPDEWTEFRQPNKGSVALNRVGGNAQSKIFGKLTANGNIMIINPNGVLFGAGSTIDINSLIVSTADISNANFENGQFVFDKPGNPNAFIINHGTITAKDAGLVGLVAPNVENSGIITANLGRVHLASGDTATIDLYGDGLMEVAVSDDVTSQSVTNTGTINAAGGTIALTAAAGSKIVNSLITVKGELNAPTVGTRGGKIYIYAEGSNAVKGNVKANQGKKSGKSTVLVDAKLNVAGDDIGEKAGSVDILADQVWISGNTHINASGFNAGGLVHIGGNFHGLDVTPTALMTIVDAGSLIEANSISSGNAGEVVVWADKETRFSGTITADAKGNEGDGGNVETSGQQILFIGGSASVSATSRRRKGTWLLDPNDITIQATGSDSNVSPGPNFSSTNDSSIVTTKSIQDALNQGTNVTIETTKSGSDSQLGNITVASKISVSPANDTTLTLKAHNAIIISNATGIEASGSNKLNIILNADSDGIDGGYVNIQGSALKSNGGNITIGGGDDPYNKSAVGTSALAYGVYLNTGVTIDSGQGEISIRGEGYSPSVANNGYSGVYLRNGVSITSTSGKINIYGVGGAGAATNTNHGITTSHSNNKITSSTGDIYLNGVGRGTSSSNGINLASSSTEISTGGLGKLTLEGSSLSTSGAGHGVATASGATLQTENGELKITGSSGTGAGTNGVSLGVTTVKTTGNGAITIEGSGGSETSTSSNTGVEILGTGNITSTSGAITITGIVKGTGGTNYGVASAGKISTEGNIKIGGTAYGAGASNYGTYMQNGSEVTTTGSGTITIEGTGSTTGTTTNNFGIYFYAGKYTTDSGKITFKGTGGGGTSTVAGIYNSGLASTISSNSGDIYITGTGGGTTTGNDGIAMLVASSISTKGTGKIVIEGTSGAGTASNTGLSLYGTFTTEDGDITITGESKGTTSTNVGIDTTTNTTIKSTGKGNIYLKGLGSQSANSVNNYGICLHHATLIETKKGDLTVEGIGGTGTNTTHGIYTNTALSGVKNRVLTEDGNIKIIGTAGGTGSGNIGISFYDFAAKASGTGTIDISGKGSQTGTGTGAYGVIFANTSSVETVSGKLKISGTGATGTTNNFGVYLYNNTTITSNGGLIEITGTGGGSGTGSSNDGIEMTATSVIDANGTSAVKITGYGGTVGTGGSNFGALLTGTITSEEGDITIEGTGGGSGASNVGLSITNLSIKSSGIGNIKLTGYGSTTGTTSTNTGIYSYSTTVLNLETKSGNIDLIGIGGTGASTGNAYTGNSGIILGVGTGAGKYIKSESGNINISGTTNDTVSGNYNLGTYLNFMPVSTGADGNVTIKGTSKSSSGGNNWGTTLSTNNITVYNGDVDIEGQGGGLSDGYGVYIYNSTIDADGDGVIDIYGAGSNKASQISASNSAHTNNYGIIFDNANTTNKNVVNTENGTIKIEGLGGYGSDTGYGIYATATYKTTEVTSTSGSISIKGTAQGTGKGSIGVGLKNITVSTGSAGTIDITGIGSTNSTGAYNYGISLDAAYSIKSDTGTISIKGTGGTGAGGVTNAGHGNIGIVSWTTAGTKEITSNSGSISLTGEALGTTSGYYNIGVQLNPMSISTGGAGQIDILGKGGAGSYYNYGICTNATTIKTTGTGALTLTGLGRSSGMAATATNNDGIYFGYSSTAQTESGKLEVVGVGAAGTASNYGINIVNGTNYIKSTSGNIEVRGTGGGTTSSNYGIYSTTGSNITTGIVSGSSNGTSGTITLKGYGTSLAGATTDNYGIHFYNGTTVQAANGKIDIQGTGGAGTTNNRGIYTSVGTNSISTDGAIYIKGTSEGTGASGNDGVSFANANVKSNLSTLTIEGYGSTVGGGMGVYISQGTMQTTSGKLYIYGEGGKLSTSDNNSGVHFYNVGNAKSTTGAIEIIGKGGSGKSNNYGIYTGTTSNEISSTTGDIKLTGTSSGTTTGNAGLYLSSVLINTTGTGTDSGGIQADDGNYYEGDITLSGTGSNSGSSSNYGIHISGTVESKGTGLVKISGTGGNGTGSDNVGVWLYNNAKIATKNTKLLIEGTGGAGTNGNYGIQTTTGTNQILSTSGDIYLLGKGKGTTSSNSGVYLNTTTVKTQNGGLIDIKGYGTDYATATTDNYGVYIYNSSTLQSDTGTLTITGEGGTGTNSNYGIYTNIGTINITSNANISLTGTGKGTGTGSTGLYLSNIALSATGSNNIMLKGIGSTLGGGSGMILTGSVSTGSGELKVEATGGSKTSSTYTDNYGLYMYNGASIYSTTGAVNVTAVGGTGTSNNYGIFSSLGTNKISSTSGDVTISGTAIGTGSGNYGIFTNNSTTTSFATGVDGKLTVTGQGSLSATLTNNSGITLNGTTTVSTANGALKLTGLGGKGSADNQGIYANNADIKATGTGTVEITGTAEANNSTATTGNMGVYLTGASKVSATSGALTILGTAGKGTSSNYGIVIHSGTSLTTTSGLLTVTGKGTEATTGVTTDNHGIFFQNSGATTNKITTTSGNIVLTGTGAAKGTSSNSGIIFGITGTNKITSTSGTISIKGTGGTSTTSTNNSGVDMAVVNIETGASDYVDPLDSSKITYAINITGTGGNGTNTNYGVSYGSTSTIASTGSGSIVIKGTGSSGTTQWLNHGIFGAGSITSNTGDITLTGVSGTGGGSFDYANDGLQLSGSIRSTSGNINLTGSALGTSGYYNRGIAFGTIDITTGLTKDGSNKFTVSNSTSGNINITGAGSLGSTAYYNYGIQGTAVTIGSSLGTIKLDGTAGKGAGNSDFGNSGLWIGGTFTTAGGNIDMLGDHLDNTTGNNTGSTNSKAYGVVFAAATTITTTGSGAVNVIGKTSSAATTGYYNYGLYVANAFNLTTASGNINLKGTAEAGAGNGSLDSFGNHGIYIYPTTTKTITSTSGDINIEGKVASGVTGARNIGTYIYDTTISTGNAGKITISGTGNGANTSYGVDLVTTTVKTTGSGKVEITGTGSSTSNSTNYGIYLNTSTVIKADGGADIILNGSSTGSTDIYAVTGTNTIGDATKANNITFNADSVSFTNTTTKTSSSGSVTFKPRTTSKAMNILGGTGGLDITSTIIGTITTGNLIFGDSSTSGGMNISAGTWGANTKFLNSGDITFKGAQTLGTNTLTAVGKDITLNSGATITSTKTSGNSIVLAASGKFTNSTGSATPLSAGTGAYYVIYSANPANDSMGSMVVPSKKYYNKSYSTFSPDNISGQNAWVYNSAYDGIITITALAQNVTYGTAPNSSPVYNTTYTVSCSDGCTGSSVFTSGPTIGFSGSAGTSASGNYNAGTWTINISGGTIDSAFADYTLSYVTGTLTVTPKAITVSSGISGVDKVYNGLTAASLNFSSPALSGVISPDDVSLDTAGYSANYTSAGAGNNKSMIVSGLALSGAGAGNYTLTQPTNVTGNITKASLTITANNKTMVYGTGNTGNGFSSSGLQNSETIGSVTYSSDATLSNGGHWNSGSWALTPSAATGGTFNTANYNIFYSSGTLDISKATLTVNAAAKTKIYGDTDPALTYSTSGIASGDTSVISGSLSRDSGEDVGTYDITQGSLSVTSNYTLNFSGNHLTVTPKELTASLTGSTVKTYDQTTTATLGSSNYTLSGVINGDAVTLNNPTTGAYNDANAGTNKNVSVSGLSLNGLKSSNYTLASTSINGNIGQIDQKEITITGVTAQNKTYDRTNSVTLNNGLAGLSGIIGGDNVTLNSSSGTGIFIDINVGSGKAISVSGYGLQGTAAANYKLTQPTGITADISAATIVASLVGSTTKTYDKTDTATLTGSNYSLSGIIDGDTVNLNNPTTGTYADVNAGTNKLVSVTGLSLSGLNSGNYILDTTSISGNIGNIDAKTISASLTGSTTKIYDKTNTAALAGSNYNLSGIIDGDVVNLNNPTTGTYADVNVGTNKSVSVSGLSLSGGAANNYVLDTTSISANIGNITAKEIAANLVGSTSKTYDKTNTASLDNSNYNLSGIIDGDVVNLNNPTTGTYADVNAGTNKLVSVNGLEISGTNAGNYILAADSISANIGNIDAKTISASLTGSTTKIYDKTNTAALDNSNYNLSGIIDGDIVNLNNPTTGTYADVNAGSNKSVSVSGLEISGGAANNYVLDTTSISANIGNITAKEITANLIGSTTKVYDKTNTANLGSSNYNLNGIIDGDVVNLNNPTTGTYADVNVGTNKSVSVSGLEISGINSDNYILAADSISANIGNITAKEIAANLVGSTTKVYDKTNTAALDNSNYNLSGIIDGDVVNLNNPTTGTYADVNAGTNKLVSVNGLEITGTNAGNYILAADAISGNIGNIDAKTISASLTGSTTKIYDKTNTAALDNSNYNLSGIIDGDIVNLNNPTTGTYADVNAGSNKSVSVSGLEISGTNAGNYILAADSISNNIGNIDAKTISASLTGSTTKVYDKTNTATLDNSNYNLSGIIDGDIVNLNNPTTGLYSDYNAGTAKNVNVSGLSLSGGSAGNYILASNSISGNIGNIDAKTISASLTGSTTKIYDKTNTAALGNSNYNLSGIIDGDIVNLNNPITGTYADVNVGTNKSVSVTGLEISGTNAGNYILAVDSISGNIGNIDAKTISASLTGSTTKVYDKTNTAALDNSNYNLNGIIDGDVVNLNNPTTGTYADVNAGTNKSVSVNGLEISGINSGNYILAADSISANIGSITAKEIAASLVGSTTKIYDKTNTAALDNSNYNLSGIIDGDIVNLNNPTTGTYADVNAGTNKTVSANGLEISGINAGNYVLASDSISGNIGNIDAKTITASLTGSTAKIYDRTNTATLDNNNYSLSGVISGDTVNLNNPTTGLYSDYNVGNSKTISVNGLSLSGSASSNYILAADSISGNIGSILAKQLTASLTGSTTKTYDKTNTANLGSSNYNLSGIIDGDTVNLNNPTTGTYADINAGTNKSVSVNGLSISGTNAGNYILASNSVSGNIGNIDAKTISASLTGSTTKVYDKTNTAALGNSNYNLNGIIDGDVVNLNNPTTGSYTDVNVGSNKSVNVSGLSLSGTNAANYVLDTTSISGNIGNITAKEIAANLVGSTTKTYDKTNTANLGSGNYNLSGIIDGDVVNLNNPTTGTYADVNVGSNKTVNVNGLEISGTNASNYVLAANNISGNIGNITAKEIAANLVGSTSKTYDKTNTANLGSSNYNLSGVISGDVVNLNNPTTGTYTDVNAGTNKTVSVNGLSISGTNSGNYILASNSISGNIGNITAKEITANLTGSTSKTYDKTNTANLGSSNYSLSGVILGDTVNLNNPTTGLYSDYNVGTAKNVNVSGLSLSGSSAGNYVLASNSISGNIGNISAKQLTVTATSGSKTYGNADSALAYTYSGLVSGDSSANFTGTLSRAAGENVNTYAIGLNNLAATGNYVIGSFNAGLYTINRAALNMTANNATREKGQINPSFSASYSGFKNGDNAASLGNVTFHTFANNTSAVGSYDIAPYATSSNYTINFIKGTLSVTEPVIVAPAVTIPDSAINKSYSLTSDFNKVVNSSGSMDVQVEKPAPKLSLSITDSTTKTQPETRVTETKPEKTAPVETTGNHSTNVKTMTAEEDITPSESDNQSTESPDNSVKLENEIKANSLEPQSNNYSGEEQENNLLKKGKAKIQSVTRKLMQFLKS